MLSEIPGRGLTPYVIVLNTRDENGPLFPASTRSPIVSACGPHFGMVAILRQNWHQALGAFTSIA
jgi:hypothetical protein